MPVLHPTPPSTPPPHYSCQLSRTLTRALPPTRNPRTVYILISHRLFELTNTLKNAVVPHSNDSLLARNCVMMAVIGLALWAVVALIYNLVVIVE